MIIKHKRSLPEQYCPSSSATVNNNKNATSPIQLIVSKKFVGSNEISRNPCSPNAAPIVTPPYRNKPIPSSSSRFSTASEFLECHETIKAPLPSNQRKQNFSDTDDFLKEIQHFAEKEDEYRVKPSYLEAHTELNSAMIAVLVDWMMETCKSLSMSRTTFHHSALHVHRYLSATENVHTDKLQLVGLTAMVVACKFNEANVLSLEDFAKTAKGSFTLGQIQEMELSMIKAFEWKLYPPTLFFWADRYTLQWDKFCKESSDILSITFRECDPDSIMRFAQLLQLVDCFSLSVGHLQFSKQLLIVSTIYILLSLHYDLYSIKEILEVFPSKSEFLFEASWFNEIYGRFLKTNLNLELKEILPGIQYVAAFIDMPFEYEEDKSSDQVVATQTHNRELSRFLNNLYNPGM